METLAQVLKWVLAGGAGAIAYWLIERVPALGKLSKEMKGYVSLAIAAALASGAFYLGVVMGYESAPTDVKAWVEAIFSAVMVATVVSKVAHARLQLSK